MRRCAFLTMLDPGDYVIDDELALAPLRALGWQVDAVPWNRPPTGWDAYDLVVIRSPWDYHYHLDEFIDVLAEIERVGVELENPLTLVRWNLRKTYLRDLAARGVPTVPTVWRDRLAPGDLVRLFDDVSTDEIVVKPVVSASAIGAYRLRRDAPGPAVHDAEAYFADRALMAQPLARAVLDEGEYSLLYFNGELSHTILKTPKAGDFRVQEERGGTIRAVVADAALQEAGTIALGALDEPPLYARADFVRANGGEGYWLMELELVEPSLYLRMDAQAPGRFARAIDSRMRRS